MWFKRAILIWILFVGIIGCTEQQRQQIDRAAVGTQQLVTDVNTLMQTPTGQMLPADIKLYAGLAALLASVGANAWQEWRNKQMTKTTKAIVKGIDQAERKTKNSNTPVAEVKAAIKEAMVATGCYERCNKIVDVLKIS